MLSLNAVAAFIAASRRHLCRKKALDRFTVRGRKDMIISGWKFSSEQHNTVLSTRFCWYGWSLISHQSIIPHEEKTDKRFRFAFFGRYSWATAIIVPVSWERYRWAVKLKMKFIQSVIELVLVDAVLYLFWLWVQFLNLSSIFIQSYRRNLFNRNKSRTWLP